MMDNPFVKIDNEFRKLMKERFNEFVDNLPPKVDRLYFSVDKKSVSISYQEPDY